MKLSINRAAIAVAAAFAGLAGCGGGSSDPVASGVSIPGQIINAASGTRVQTANVTISDSEQVQLVDASGNPASSVNTTSGAVALYLNPGVTPTATDPVEFDVTISASGMVPLKQRMRIESAQSAPIVLRMLSSQTDASGQLTGLGTLAAGTQATTQYQSGSIAPSSSSGYTAKAVYQPASQQASPVEVEVTLPQDAGPGRLVGGSFVAAAAGELKLQIITADPAAPDADKILPQFAVTDTSKGATYVAASGLSSFAKINVFDQAGNPVTRFQNPIRITLELPAASINPKTGKRYAIGDAVDIVTFDESRSAWVMHQMNGQAATGTVTGFNAASGNARVEFQTDHLSDYGTPGAAGTGTIAAYATTMDLQTGSSCPAGTIASMTLKSVNFFLTLKNTSQVITGAGSYDAPSNSYKANFYVAAPSSPTTYSTGGTYTYEQYDPITGQTTTRTDGKLLPREVDISAGATKAEPWELPVTCHSVITGTSTGG